MLCSAMCMWLCVVVVNLRVLIKIYYTILVVIDVYIRAFHFVRSIQLLAITRITVTISAGEDVASGCQIAAKSTNDFEQSLLVLCVLAALGVRLYVCVSVF